MCYCAMDPRPQINIQQESLTQNLSTVSAALLLKDGSTALFKAAFNGQNSVVEELLKFSPSLGLLKVDNFMPPQHQLKNKITEIWMPIHQGCYVFL